jgi:lipopolysaccharide export system ATP-binding protein
MTAGSAGLRALGLYQAYRGRNVLENVDLEISPGEVVGLLGPNGSGKTTALSILAGLVRPDQGQVFLGDRELTALALHVRARLGLSYIPQDSSIFPRLSVRENLLALTEYISISQTERTSRMERAASDLKLGDLLDSKGAQLSGGEKKRVEIARALMLGARYLLLDEPFAGLDPHGRSEVGRVLEILRVSGKGVLVTDHSFEEVLRFTSRLYVLAEGRTVCQGTPSEVVDNPAAQSAYFRTSPA